MLIFDNIDNKIEKLTSPLITEMSLIEKSLYELYKNHKYKISNFKFIKEYYLKKIIKKIQHNKNISIFYKKDIIIITSGLFSVVWELDNFPYSLSKKISYIKQYQDFNCSVTLEKIERNISTHGYNFELNIDGFKKCYTSKIYLKTNSSYISIEDYAYYQNNNKDKLCIAYIFENINKDYEDIMDSLYIQFDVLDDLNRYSDIIKSLKNFMLIFT